MIIRDKIYGGVFFGEEEAKKAAEKNCPSTEIFLSYLKGLEKSPSGVVMSGDVIEKIESHLRQCGRCSNLSAFLLKESSFNKKEI